MAKHGVTTDGGQTAFDHIGVIGGGAWGTALAAAARAAGRQVTLWAREADVVDSINTAHENTRFLPGCTLDRDLRATADMADIGQTDAVLVVSPAQYVRDSLEALHPCLRPDTPLLLCAKGIEIASGKLLSQVVVDIIQNADIGILSGPTFAKEVASGLPCAMTLASKNTALADSLAQALSSPSVRLYASADVIGAQVGGAVKNVLAIATGLVEGLGLGENARAALITRGMAEIMRFGDHMGADRETLMGLSGLGDVLLTCSSQQSRNFSLGYALGQGQSLDDIMATRETVAEGAHTAKILAKLARNNGIDMPIMLATHAIVHEGADARETAAALLARPLTREN